MPAPGNIDAVVCPCSAEHELCLKRVPIFKDLNEEEMLEISGIVSSRYLKKGEFAYVAGDKRNALLVINSGLIKLFRLSTGGKEQVLEILGPGEFIGELTLFSSLPLSDFAEALEDSRLCVLEGEKLKQLMAKYPQIAFKTLDALSRRLTTAEGRIESISLGPVASRLAAALLDLADSTDVVYLPMSKGDLASQLGMSQETLSRKLTEFQDEGLILLEGQRKISILKQDILKGIIKRY